MKAPATLDEFYRTFPTERRCWEALRRLRWPDGFRCPRCAGRNAHRLRARGLYSLRVEPPERSFPSFDRMRHTAGASTGFTR